MKMLRVPAATAATPLLALTAVSLDTEATSLDVKSGRVIEIGAVAIVNGSLIESLVFEKLVACGQSIPPEATAIHGITDADVEGAEAFVAVWRDFRAFSARHVLLGYSLDFDLLLLEQEHVRAGMAWKPSIALDVRSLVQVLRPNLPDYALETVASWLGIAVQGRHRAKVDAILTAKVFFAMLPKLREKNIRTLGEALQACNKAERQAGQTAQAAGRLQNPAIAKTDSFPYRHRIADVMSVPALKVQATMTLAAAMYMMLERKVSSLFVEGKKPGIVTERDVLRALAADRAKAFERKVGDIATFPLRTVAAEDFIYVAIGLMSRLRIRHLGVTDETGALVGALSQRDLLRMRADEALSLTIALDDAATPAELAVIWRKLADAARALLAEDVDARDVAAIISSEVCALTARAAAMAEKEHAGDRPPGLRFAVMVLGSGGRGESLLALDQDNAIIHDGGGVAADAWLEKFASRMNSLLDEIGVPLCKGGVMARNSQWRLSVQGWQKQVETWLGRNNPSDIMNADIFFDSVAVYGDETLADDLRDRAIAAASQSQAFLKLMSLNAAETGSAINWLGRFSVDETGRLDLKRLGIMPIFTAARVAALRYRIHERSTLARLAALRGNPDVPQHQLEILGEAHGELMGFILRQQLDDVEHGIPPNNKVAPQALSAFERDRLKRALQQVRHVADLVGTPQA